MELVRLLSLDGPVVGVGVVAALVWLGVTLTSVRSELRNFKSENKEAHAGIAKNIDGVKQDVRDVKQDVRDAKQDIRDVKQDVPHAHLAPSEPRGTAGLLTGRAPAGASGACSVRRPSHRSLPLASPLDSCTMKLGCGPAGGTGHMAQVRRCPSLLVWSRAGPHPRSRGLPSRRP